MDILMNIALEETILYSITFLVCFTIVAFYIVRDKRKSKTIEEKVKIAKKAGKFEPISLHPFINLDTCIGSGACVKACPEKDILGIVNGKATVINASSCIGHGACFHACPVEAISLRIGTEKRGVDLPHIKPTYETNVPGIYIAGELGGMGLIKNSTEQGKQAIDNLVKKKKPTVPNILDLVIVGAGPAGIAAALNAKKNNLTFKIVEQDSLGGTVFTFPREKVVMTNPMDLPLYGKLKLFNTTKLELLNIWQDILKQHDIQIQEHTKIDSIAQMENGPFKLSYQTDKELISNQVLIAIGRRGTPRKLGVPGEESTKVAYRLLELENIKNKKVLVVGGGDSAIESAMLLMKNNEVTLSYRKDKFARIKSQNQTNIDKAILEQKIKPVFNSNLVEIFDNSITFSIKNKPEIHSLENDLVYIFAGGELPIQFLKNAGISVEKTFGKIVRKY